MKIVEAERTIFVVRGGIILTTYEISHAINKFDTIVPGASVFTLVMSCPMIPCALRTPNINHFILKQRPVE
jgi:hypothetical protein